MDSRQGVAAGPGITLAPLEPDDREQFTADNQEAFLHGATQGFDMRDDHFEEDGQIIFRGTIERAIGGEHAEAWRIVVGDRAVGGIVLNIDGTARRGELELLFASPDAHSNSRGIGQAAWREVERMRPGVRTWGLVIPYFEKRNIHFHGPPGTGPCFVGFLCCFGCGGGVRVGVAPEETAVLVGWRRRSGSRVLAGMKAEAVLHASRGVDAGVIAGMVERTERTVQEWPAEWRGTRMRRVPAGHAGNRDAVEPVRARKQEPETILARPLGARGPDPPHAAPERGQRTRAVRGPAEDVPVLLRRPPPDQQNSRAAPDRAEPGHLADDPRTGPAPTRNRGRQDRGRPGRRPIPPCESVDRPPRARPAAGAHHADPSAAVRARPPTRPGTSGTRSGTTPPPSSARHPKKPSAHPPHTSPAEHSTTTPNTFPPRETRNDPAP